jgi:hypothetical protein
LAQSNNSLFVRALHLATLAVNICRCCINYAAELRPVLPRPPSGPIHTSSSGNPHAHPQRHHCTAQAPYELAYAMAHHASIPTWLHLHNRIPRSTSGQKYLYRDPIFVRPWLSSPQPCHEYTIAFCLCLLYKPRCLWYLPRLHNRVPSCFCASYRRHGPVNTKRPIRTCCRVASTSLF